LRRTSFLTFLARALSAHPLPSSDSVSLNKPRFVLLSLPLLFSYPAFPPADRSSCRSQLGGATYLSNLVSSGTVPDSKFSLFLSASVLCSRVFLGGAADAVLTSGSGIRIPVIANAGQVRFTSSSSSLSSFSSPSLSKQVVADSSLYRFCVHSGLSRLRTTSPLGRTSFSTRLLFSTALPPPYAFLDHSLPFFLLAVLTAPSLKLSISSTTHPYRQLD
jgi:hypothetical protein